MMDPLRDDDVIRRELDRAAGAVSDPGDLIDRMYARAGRKQRNRRLAQGAAALLVVPAVAATAWLATDALGEPIQPATSSTGQRATGLPTTGLPSTGLPSTGLPSTSGLWTPRPTGTGTGDSTSGQPAVGPAELDLVPRVEQRRLGEQVRTVLVTDDREVQLPETVSGPALIADNVADGWFLSNRDNEYVSGRDAGEPAAAYVAADGRAAAVSAQVFLIRDSDRALLLEGDQWHLTNDPARLGTSHATWGSTVDYVVGTPAGIFIRMSDGGTGETRVLTRDGTSLTPLPLPGRPIGRAGDAATAYTLVDDQPGCVARVSIPYGTVEQVGCGVGEQPVYRELDGRATLLSQDSDLLRVLDLATTDTRRIPFEGQLSGTWEKTATFAARPRPGGGTDVVRCDLGPAWTADRITCDVIAAPGVGLLGVPLEG